MAQIPNHPINKFTPENNTYVSDFEEMRLLTNEIEEEIVRLRSTYLTLAARFGRYITNAELDGFVQSIMSAPNDITQISIQTFSFTYTGGSCYLGGNMLAKVPLFTDIAYPTTTTPHNILVKNGAFTAAPSLPIESVLDTSTLPYTDAAFLYNNNGVLTSQRTIPLSTIYGATSFSGLPAGAIIRWNGEAETDSMFMPPAAAWGYPSSTTRHTEPLKLNSNIPTNTNLWSGVSTMYVPWTSATPTSSGTWTKTNAKSVNWFFADTTCYATVSFEDQRGTSYTSAEYYSFNYNRWCLAISPLTKMRVDALPLSVFDTNGDSGVLFDIGIRFSQTSISLDPNNQTMVVPLFTYMVYENYGNSAIGVYFYANRNTSGVYSYSLGLSFHYWASSGPTLPITLEEITQGWIDLTFISQNGKYKIFKNKIEVASGSLRMVAPNANCSRLIIFGNTYTYSSSTGSEGIFDPVTYSRWSNTFYFSLEKLLLGTKDIYFLDWNATNNTLFRSKEQFKALPCDREWSVYKGQYPELFAAIGTAYNSNSDNLDGTVFRIPVSSSGMLMRGVDYGAGNHKNTGLYTSGDNLLSKSPTYLVQSHTHDCTLALPFYTAGNSLSSFNYSSSVVGTNPIVTGMGSNINSTISLSLSPTDTTSPSVTKNMAERWLLVTGVK
jgi:hypothetical protein